MPLYIAGPSSLSEGSSGTAVVVRWMGGPLPTPLTVSWTVNNDTATRPGDFRLFDPLTGQELPSDQNQFSTTLAAGTTGGFTIPLQAMLDNLRESTESFSLSLLPGSGYEIAHPNPSYPSPGACAIAITDVPVQVTISAQNYGREGGGVPYPPAFKVTRGGGDASQPLTVTVAEDSGGSAHAGSDFTFASAVTIPAGAAEAVVPFSIIDDGVPEWTETAKLKVLPDSQHYILGASTAAEVDIIDNDLDIVLDGLAEGQEENPGSYVRVNDDDDNENGVPDRDDPAPVFNEDDLVTLTLTIPAEVKQGATITLSLSSANAVVWLNSGGSWSHLLDAGTPNRTWTIGQETVPTSLQLEIIAPSATTRDVQLALHSSDANATPKPRVATTVTDVAIASGVKLTLHQARYAVNGVITTECMERDRLSYTLHAAGLPDGQQFTYTEYLNGPVWGSCTFTDDNDWTRQATASDVPAGDSDHHYTRGEHITLTLGGRIFRSNTINVEVYELWIEHFRDAATGKAWKVCVGDSIAYSAIAVNACTNWVWDMEDGVPDAWNPTGGNAKTGSGMVIPFSDEVRASNDWFGDTYGSVTVRCRDVTGNLHEFTSTEMGAKAKVFFDPARATDGSAPSQTNPPAWFVFWQQTGAGDSRIEYDHSLGGGTLGVTSFTYDTSTQVVLSVDSPKVGPDAIITRTLGGPSAADHGIISGPVVSGIDTFRSVVLHELLHYTDLTASIGAPNPDGDFITTVEGDTNGNGIWDPGETSPLLGDTHAAATPSGSGDTEYRAYWHEVNVWAAEVGRYDTVDWSKGGKQW